MEGNMTVEGFLEATLKLNVQQQTIREEEQDKADESETEELNNLRQASIASASSEPSNFHWLLLEWILQNMVRHFVTHKQLQADKRHPI